MTRFILLALIGLISGCTGVPDGVTVIDNFDINRYLGQWYEIARLDHSFERGLVRVKAEYRLREDGGISVVNSGFDQSSGKRKTATGKAFFTGASNRGSLKVSFFGPFYGGYNIMDLDSNYQYAMIAGPNRDYLWILSRTPTLPASTLNKLVGKAKQLGFATETLIFTQQ